MNFTIHHFRDIKMNMKKIYFIVLVSFFSCQIYGAQGALRRIEIASINKLQGQLRPYRDNDAHLKELYDVLATQKAQLEDYNKLIIATESLTAEQKALVYNNAFQDLINISDVEIERLSQLSSVIMQSKNIDPSWQIAKYGNVLGSISFIKNLFVPRDVQSYICAGVGAVTGLTVFKNMQKTSPTIEINVPQGATNITIKDDSQQKLATTVAVCALGAGGLVAGSQLYNSWMHGQNSRDTLADKIAVIKTSNAQIGSMFATIGIHNVLNAAAVEQVRQRQAIGALDNRVVQLQAGIDVVSHGVAQLQQGADQDRQANSVRHQEVTNQLTGLNQKVDKLIFDQGNFQQFVTSLVTDSHEKSNARHEEVKKEVQGVSAAVSSFRNESAVAYNNLDTKLTNVQKGIAQGQSRLENLIMNGQQQNRPQLSGRYNNYQNNALMGFGSFMQIQNQSLDHGESTLEEIE